MWLFWAVGAIYLVASLYLVMQTGLPGQVPLAIGYALVIGLLALLIRAVAKGRNWARITYSVLVAAASLLIVVGLLFAPEKLSTARQLLSGLLVASYAVIIWLLFHRDSSYWFKKDRASAT